MSTVAKSVDFDNFIPEIIAINNLGGDDIIHLKITNYRAGDRIKLTKPKLRGSDVSTLLHRIVSITIDRAIDDDLSATTFRGFRLYGTSGFPNANSVTLPDGMVLTTIDTSNLTVIEGFAFNDCSALTTIAASSVTTIGGYAFKGCSALTTIDTSSVTTIAGGCAFMGCSALTSIT